MHPVISQHQPQATLSVYPLKELTFSPCMDLLACMYINRSPHTRHSVEIGVISIGQWQHQTMEQLALPNVKNLRRSSTPWIMTHKALKILLICPCKSIYTAIVYNDLCIIMYLKQYDISLLHTHNTHAHA